MLSFAEGREDSSGLSMNTIGFADHLENHQCIAISNLAEEPETFLFAIDYAHRRRVKIWGRARVVENDAALERHLMPDGVEGHPEAAISFEIHAWDTICPRNNSQKFDADTVAAALAERDAEIARLTARMERVMHLP
jgi:predicted pyridoxine 5'-phosphate oxidase superfamily flavin-nucleotide-binding protein